MRQVILTKGLPGSGKSTYAKELVNSAPHVYKRISKDDLRAMFDNSRWSSINEKFVLKIRDLLIIAALDGGYSVIIDDTNFAEQHLIRISELVAKWSLETNILVNMQVKFFDAPVEECIARDLRRPNSVGEQVIRRMYERYLQPKIEPMIQDENLPHIVLCDIDGTISKMSGRSPFEWSRVEEDLPNKPVIELLKKFYNEMPRNISSVIFFSGRDGSCEQATRNWLIKNGFPSPELYMRAAGDMRKDTIVKRELFDRYIRGKYFVQFVLDDRDSCISLWRRDLGLTALQVDYGNF